MTAVPTQPERALPDDWDELFDDILGNAMPGDRQAEVEQSAELLRTIPTDRLVRHWREAGDACTADPAATGLPVLDFVTNYVWVRDKSRPYNSRPSRRVTGVERPSLRSDEVLGRAARSLAPELLDPHRTCTHQGHAIALVCHDEATEGDVAHAVRLLRDATEWHPGLIRALLARPRAAGATSDLLGLLSQPRQPYAPATLLTRLVGPLFDHFLPSALRGADPTVLGHFAAQPLRQEARHLFAESALVLECLDVATRKVRVDAARRSPHADVQWVSYDAGRQRDVLANRLLDESVVIRALRHPDERLWGPAARLAPLTPGAFACGIRRFEVRVAIAGNPHLSPAQMKVLLDDRAPAVRAAVLANPRVTVQVLAQIAGQGNGEDVTAHLLDLL